MKPKRSIYRVIPIVEKHKLVGWKVKGPGGYTASFMWINDGYKRDAIKLAVSLAKDNPPSQVIIHAKDRVTGKYEMAVEWSYGCDSRAKG